MSMLSDLALESSRMGTDAGIDHLFHRILARDPTPSERRWMTELLQSDDNAMPDVPQNQWTYGVATYRAENGTVEGFRTLPRYHADRWQGPKEELPDPDWDWAFLNASGGHPGGRPDLAVVRRWVAFHPATVRVRGMLKHPSENGNGIRAAIVLRGNQRVGEWSLKQGETETRVDELEVHAGDTLDFVTDANGDTNSDGFEWKVRIVSQDESDTRTNSERHFSAQQPRVLTPWEQATQALLLTNEFCFVD